MQYETDHQRVVLRLIKGEMLISSLRTLSRALKIEAAEFCGIGACCNLLLGYYHIDKKDYEKKNFDGNYEILSLHGNISLLNGDPFIHTHIVLGDSQFNVIGGHLFDAEVSVTAEIFITCFGKKISRKKDSLTELNLLDLKETI